MLAWALHSCDQAVLSVNQNPEQYQRVRGQIRRALLHKFPYGVFYVARPEFSSVIAVLHHARDPKHWQQRAPVAR